ncbi:MAG: hypothetical protein ACYTHM_09535 [Planctomycetota bacterium]|jgi:DNA-directed RNA polymerase subunit RPC12/RpoP
MAVMDVIYRCLRCGHEYEGEYDSAKGPQELTCVKCKSNSVRRLPKNSVKK